MKKRKNGKRNVSDFQPLEYMLSPEETLKIMEKGTNVSCKLTFVPFSIIFNVSSGLSLYSRG